jgi:hypothetical protein
VEKQLMKGLALSEEYYRAFGAAMIETQFPAYRNRIAVGLAGLGSECFGFDDEISRDHDWGPGFCMWLNKSDYDTIGVPLQKAYDALPDFMGFHRQKSSWGEGRVGVLSTDDFYASFIGLSRAPENPRQWLAIPEPSLAACTNGRVFTDPPGEFTTIRRDLLKYYPEDIRLKRIAARCMTAAQSGQYNYPRSLRRNAVYPAFQALAKFCDDAVSLLFLLNRCYMPFYKWVLTAARDLPLLGAEISEAIENLIGEQKGREKEHRIEAICTTLIEALKAQELSDSPSDFLLDHGPSVHSRIRDEIVKSLDIWWPGA